MILEKVKMDGLANTIDAVKSRLAEELRPLMIDIKSDEFYEAIMELKSIFNPQMRELMGITETKLSEMFKADKELIDRIETAIEKDEDKVRDLATRVDHYVAEVKEMKIRDWVVRDRGYGVMRSFWRYLSLLLTFPFFLFGFITNVVPYLVPVYMARNIKDRQFQASVKNGLGMLILFPLVYLLETLLVGFLTGPWWIWLAFLVLLFPMGKVALAWYLRWKKTVRGSWFARKLRRSDPAAAGLVRQRDEIIELTKGLV